MAPLYGKQYKTPDYDDENAGERVSVIREIFDWVKHIVIAVIVGVLFITFVGQRTVVYGMSMYPTLENGDQLVIEKISPKIGGIKHGDIITIYIHGLLDEGKDYLIKRVIALEGDTIRIEDGTVYLNGQILDEDYIRGDYTYEERLTSEITIDKGQVFVMGDNRFKGGSNDSRSLGVFNMTEVRGKAILRWFPFAKFGKIK